MSKVKGIISLVLVIAALVCMTVGFSSYWYAEGNDDAVVFYKYDSIRTVTLDDGYIDDIRNHKYTSREKAENKNALSIFNASLAFTVLAWLVLLIAAIFIILQTFGLTMKFPILIVVVPMIGKLILIVATIFSLLAMFIFVGLGDARKRDCRKMYGDMDSTYDYCDEVDWSFVYSQDDSYRAPTTSWIAVVVGTAFTIAAMIMNFCGVFEVTPVS